MDFDHAAQRLAKDQSKLKGRRHVEVSAKARREAELRKKQREQVLQERQAEKRRLLHQEQYLRMSERSLGVKQLSRTGSPLQLQATSIYGEGDKIALSPDVLEFLTSSGLDSSQQGSPWTFRVGILDPEYTFPASPLLQNLTEESESAMEEDDDEDSEDETSNSKEMYLDEMKHKYLSYTHATVVEFTQEEGHVGLPQPIANALLEPAQRRAEESDRVLPVTRTVDPAAAAAKPDENAMEQDDEDEKTPGHLAWGAFDVPSDLVEVTLVTLPKGRGCTLAPTAQAVKNGFYNLKDVKLVLEQSLIRTRATLTVGDIVHTWHRGTKFDLRVTSVTPSTYQGVTCINTDIEVNIGEPEMDADLLASQKKLSTAASSGSTLTGGHVLGDSSGRRLMDEELNELAVAAYETLVAPTAPGKELLPEPPAEQVQDVCTVQIRGDGGRGARRRFDVHKATLKDLFAFAATLTSGDQNFRLVTRFPRRVFETDQTSSSSLSDAGIVSGQELFLIERA